MADQIYKAYYGELGEKRREYSQSRIDWIVENTVGEKVLDIGCSQGICSLLLAKRGFDVLGIDCVTESIAFAQERLREIQQLPPIKVKFICQDFLETDFIGEKFDTVIMSQVLEHLEQPAAFVEKAVGLLSDQGRMILTVPFGINRSPDHKRTYYLGELYQCAARYLNVLRIYIHGHWIGMICGKDAPEEMLKPDLEMVQLIERGFFEIESELRDLVDARRERIKGLERKMSRLSEATDGQRRKLSLQLKEEQRKLRTAKESYQELATSKLGRLQLAYWHSPRWIARFARFICRGLKHLFTGKAPERVYGGTRSVTGFERINGPRQVILFMATNGAGLGHLTRSLAIARRIARQKPDQEVVFLTTSTALNVVHREGFGAYHIPPKASLPSEMTTKQWGGLLTQNLNNLFELYDIRTVIFDGAYPYAQFVQSIHSRSGVEKIWVKRGGETAEKIEIRREQEKYFDHIILPGEAGKPLPAGDQRHIAVNPIIFIDKDEVLDCGQVRALFNVPADKLFVYVQLGAGQINDMQYCLSRVIETLRSAGNIMIALGESLIGDDLQTYEEDIVVIKDYPNSKYFYGFDFVVSACGYNTFHELMYFGVPSLLIPTMETGTDDQLARGMLGAEAGLAIVVTNLEDGQLESAVKRLADPAENQRMRGLAANIGFENGANDAARAVLSLNAGKAPEKQAER